MCFFHCKVLKEHVSTVILFVYRRCCNDFTTFFFSLLCFNIFLFISYVITKVQRISEREIGLRISGSENSVYKYFNIFDSQ